MASSYEGALTIGSPPRRASGTSSKVSMTGLSTASSLSATFLVINLLRIRPRLSFLHGFRGGVSFLEVCFLMVYGYKTW